MSRKISCMNRTEFKFPQKIDSYLAAAYELAKVEGSPLMAEILQSARPEFSLDVWRDELDGCVYYHNLVLNIPVKLFENVGKRKLEVEQSLKKLIEGVSMDIFTERIRLLSLLPDVKNSEWRGSRIGGRMVTTDVAARIWGSGRYKIFISHLAKEKELASDLKKQLSVFGCASFVAHEDIEPTTEWQSEIESALHSMDCLVALMTEEFHKSNWTDQEIGYALGRNLAVVPVSIGMVPYGFVGKIQAIKWAKNDVKNLGWQIFKRLPFFTTEGDAFIKAVESVDSFDDAVILAKLLSDLAPLSEAEVWRIAEIAVENRFIHESTTFWSRTKHSYGFHYYITKWLGYDLRYDHFTNSYVRVG